VEFTNEGELMQNRHQSSYFTHISAFVPHAQ